MTPGRFHAETVAPFVIAPGATVVVPLVDQDGHDATAFVLPVSDTDFDYEVSNTVLPSTLGQRANQFETYLLRLKEAGPDDDDRTGRCVRAVSPPVHTHSPNALVKKDPTGTVTVAGGSAGGAAGTTNWADTFGKHEFVNVGDGPFQLVMKHNGSGQVTVGKVVFHATNVDAIAVDRTQAAALIYSDGSVRLSDGTVVGSV